MIALIDYGVGNLRSVEKALTSVGAQVVLTSDPDLIQSAQKVVLPGVGAFRDGMLGLERKGLVQVLVAIARRRTPLLGICLGMQLLFETSVEMGEHKGLGLLPGQVLRFADHDLKVPQTGWNQVHIQRKNPLLDGLPDGSYAYFNHGFYCVPGREDDILAVTDYGIDYASVVAQGRIYGVQFHPEKSQDVGLQILRNFVEMG